MHFVSYFELVEDKSPLERASGSGVFTPNQVHRTAEIYHYKEIAHNRNSKVISFRQKTNRINVYYTTGTVGTCLNHPTKGKTQLFRRDIHTLELLESIFANPRKHTGKGYYEKYQRVKSSQDWKASGPSNNNNANNKFVTDMARRWVYVATMAGWIATNDTNRNQDSGILPILVDSMNHISRMLWKRGTEPSIDNLQYACGSLSGIMTLVFKVSQTYGIIGACEESEVRKYQQQGGGPHPPLEDLECTHECQNVQPFLNVHQKTLDIVEQMLCKLPWKIRQEVCNWLVGLQRCNLVLVNQHFQYEPLNKEIQDFHRDYSHMYYAKKHLFQVCDIHGVIVKQSE